MAIKCLRSRLLFRFLDHREMEELGAIQRHLGRSPLLETVVTNPKGVIISLSLSLSLSLSHFLIDLKISNILFGCRENFVEEKQSCSFLVCLIERKIKKRKIRISLFNFIIL
ncbi:hypothetical protein I3843_09G127900 [Carya illinoinensis]|nr:hypothetical protein I3843_09G127900 [Carya illinoinensis]